MHGLDGAYTRSFVRSFVHLWLFVGYVSPVLVSWLYVHYSSESCNGFMHVRNREYAILVGF